MRAEDEEILAVIARTLDTAPERLEPQLRFDTDLGLDSLTVVEIVMAVEDATGLRFDDEEAAAATSVGDLLALVRRKRGSS
jgi:acyl carrier protein